MTAAAMASHVNQAFMINSDAYWNVSFATGRGENTFGKPSPSPDCDRMGEAWSITLVHVISRSSCERA